MSERIVSNPAILSGTPVFAGTRVPLEDVAERIRKGAAEAELAEDFPTLSRADFELARNHAMRDGSPAAAPAPLKLRKPTKAA